MGAQSHAQHHHHDKAKVTIDCTVKNFPQDKANKETMEAIQNTKDGETTRCESLGDFWDKMGVKPSAYN